MTCTRRASILNGTIGVVGVFAVLLAVIAGYTGNVSPAKAKGALHAQGIKNVTLTGYSFFGCDSREYYSTGFTGTGADGKPVSGVVCSGFLKGVTVRYD